jgi:hypothetical protein
MRRQNKNRESKIENQYARIAIRANNNRSQPRHDQQTLVGHNRSLRVQGVGAYSYTRPRDLSKPGNRVPSGRERFLAAATRSGINQELILYARIAIRANIRNTHANSIIGA